MARRSYRQYCGLAAALDVVAQRWALLVVRDLAPGPRRFTDLFAGLPGISTDMLAERLRELEETGAVEQVEVHTPVPATLYQLTSRGRDLAAIAADLARWGMPLLPSPADADLRVNARWALQSIAARYRGGLADGDVHLTLDGTEELTLAVTGDRATLRYGHRADSPVATLSCTTHDFFELRRQPDRLLGDLPPSVLAEGDLDHLADVLRLPIPTA